MGSEKDLIYFLGYTGSGKSSLINYLMEGVEGYDKKEGRYHIYKK